MMYHGRVELTTGACLNKLKSHNLNNTPSTCMSDHRRVTRCRMSTGSHPRYRRPSGPTTIGSRHASAVSGVSNVFGVAVNSTLPISAASTLPSESSPLRHELHRSESTFSLNREEMSLSPRKRENSDGATSLASTEHFAEPSSTPTTASVLDSNKKSRSTSPDVLDSLSDGPVLQSVSVAPVSVSSDVAAAVSASSRTIWFGPLSKRFSRSSMSLSAAAEASDHALPPEPSHGSVAITQDSQ